FHILAAVSPNEPFPTLVVDSLLPGNLPLLLSQAFPHSYRGFPLTWELTGIPPLSAGGSGLLWCGDSLYEPPLVTCRVRLGQQGRHDSELFQLQFIQDLEQSSDPGEAPPSP
ncbi:hypothetical protein STEG23_015177, partial [Scotinomys teguina]